MLVTAGPNLVCAEVVGVFLQQSKRVLLKAWEALGRGCEVDLQRNTRGGNSVSSFIRRGLHAGGDGLSRHGRDRQGRKLMNLAEGRHRESQ